MRFGKNFWSKLLLAGGMIASLNMLSSNTSMASNTNDVTPPVGRISIVDSTAIDGVSYVKTNKATVSIYAVDDICANTEIMYYISTSQISSTERIDDGWIPYEPGATHEITLNEGELTKVYIVFKDASGNTTLGHSGGNTTYTVGYDANCDDGSASVATGVNTTGYFGTPFTVTSKTPTRVGYKFLGWSTEENVSKASYQPGDTIPASAFAGSNTSIPLYAVWEKSTSEEPYLADVVSVGDYVNYPVGYDSMNASSIKGWRVLSVDDGAVTLVSAGVPFTYSHGTSSTESTNALVNEFLSNSYASSGVNSNITLDEVFNNKFTAVNDDGSLAVRALTADDVIGVVGDTAFNAGDLASIANHDMFSVGGDYWLATANTAQAGNLWYVSEAGALTGASSATKGVRAVVTLKPDVKYTGRDELEAWNIEYTKVKIDFDGNGGTGSMDSLVVEAGTNYTLPSNGFTAAQYYEFAGWSVNGGATQAPGSSVEISVNTTIEAVWKKIQYTITFNGNGGSGSMAAVTQDAGSTFTLPANGFTAADYTEFVGWSVNGGATQAVGATFTVTGNTTIKAVWKKIQYTITFDGNGGSGTVASVSVDGGSSYVLPDSPFTAPQYYEFEGWSVNDGATQVTGTQVTVTSNMTLKAIWKKIQYTVMFDGNGGTGSMEAVTLDAGSNFELPENEFSYEGYTFVGWSVNDEETQAAGVQVAITGNMVMKAVWVINQVVELDSIQIGDYVEYAGDGSYTLDADLTGYADDDGMILSAERANWRVWDIEEDGSIIIIPTTPINHFYLSGLNGYNNLEDVINGVCDIYVNTDLEVTVDDIDSITIDKLQKKSESDFEVVYSEDFDSAYVLSPIWDNINNSKFPSDTYGTLLGNEYGWTTTKGLVDYNGIGFYYEVKGACSELVGNSGRGSVVGFARLYYEETSLVVYTVPASYCYGVRPLVSLSPTLEIDTSAGTRDGSSAEMAWKLKKGSTAEEVTYIDSDTGKKVYILSDDEITNTNQIGNENIEEVVQAEGETTQVPIPKGFSYMLGTGDTGLVIKDSSDNEFVWIPVEDVTTMYTEGNETSLSHYDADFSVKTTKWGKSVLGKTMYPPNGEEVSTVSVSKILKSFVSSTVYALLEPGAVENYREPAVVVGSDGASYDAASENYTQAGFTSLETFATDLRTEFDSMIASVGTYGGFYVGRYELGLNGSTVVCQPGQLVLTAAASSVTDGTNTDGNYGGSSDTQMWYGLYKACKGFTQGGVQSNMIWGTQWDAMVNFIGDHTTPVPTGNQRYLTGQHPTLNADHYNHVHDTSSNVQDWTATAQNIGYRAIRGGYYNGAYASSYRYSYYPTSTRTYYGSRPQLYIKTSEEETTTEYTITFDANGGTGSVADVTVEEGVSYVLPECPFEYEGYTFAGWSVNDGETQAAGVMITIIGNVIVKAVWEQNQVTVLGEMLQIGDYVEYEGAGSYTLDADLTGWSSEDGKILSPTSTTWRVWDINEDGSVVIMPTASVNTFYLAGATGFVNSMDIIEDVCDIYANSKLGVTADDIESLKIEELEEKSSRLTEIRDSYTNYGTKPYKYTSGRFYTLDDGLTICTARSASSSNPISPTYTYYYASSPTWNSITNSNFSSLTYGTLLGTTYSWLASPCVGLDSSNAYFRVRYANSSIVGANGLYDSDGHASSSYGVRPLVSLGSELQITGGDGKSEGTAWVLKACSETTTEYTITFDANGGSGSVANVAGEEGTSYELPECSFTAPSGKMFAGWSVNGGETQAEGTRVTVTDNMTLKAIWGEICTITFDGNGALGTKYPVQVASGTRYEIPDGEEFNNTRVIDYWTINGSKFISGDVITVTSDITLVATWGQHSGGGND